MPDSPELTSFSMEVGEVMFAKGKPIELPNGEFYSDENGKRVLGYGPYVIVEYTFMDDDRNVVNSRDVRAKESVTVDSVTPDSASGLAANLEFRPEFYNLSPGGKLYDVIAVLGSKKDSARATKLGVEIKNSQIITLRQGNSTFAIKNQISINFKSGIIKVSPE